MPQEGSVPTIFDAHTFALTAHAGQLDKCGEPCMRHLERVANAALARAGHARLSDGLDIDPMRVMQAALLHDVLEDTSRTTTDLQAAGFEADIIRTVTLLTKPASRIAYSERIAALIASGDLAALLIKMSDTEDNLRPSRIPPDAAFLRERYADAFARLKSAAAVVGYTGR
ncbi:phosphohydrolase [Methylobacterium sp. XJLW]|jgi:(p)ppGpp synthase/HD superfamily hydrolase|nr:phosphohydrolase [Methylobacterium sp. XJLW]